jgi:hypothetical protein
MRIHSFFILLCVFMCVCVQVCGEEGYNQAVDWWAMGMTIHTLLIGSNAFTRFYR